MNVVKVCSQCKVEKPLDAFKKNSRLYLGTHCFCKACDNQNQREAYAAKGGRKSRKGIKQKSRPYVPVRKKTPLEYFEARYIPVTECGCWLWISDKYPNGYGRLRYKNKSVSAHRFSWELHHGQIPKGLDVLHKCDVPGCVNPSHLFVGTHLENMLDKAKKGRTGRAKLDPCKVIEIRRLHPALTVEKLAEKFNVAKNTIHQVLKGRTWHHVQNEERLR